MSENFRTGAGAASRPRDEDLIREREGTTERAVGIDAVPVFKWIRQPENEAPYQATFIDYPLFQWSGEQIDISEVNSLTSKAYRPGSLQYEEDPTFYSVFIRWPDIGGVNNLLGMFIRSRPLGSVQWRDLSDYREFTAEKDQYGPANKNIRDSYSEQLEPSVNDEYQVVTRYSWTPNPAYAFFSDIRLGSSFPRQQPVMVADRVGFGSALPQRKDLSDVSAYFAIFGEVDEIEGAERVKNPAATGNSRYLEAIYWASFADTVEPADSDNDGNAVAMGKMISHKGVTYFIYAEDATGVIVID